MIQPLESPDPLAALAKLQTIASDFDPELLIVAAGVAEDAPPHVMSAQTSKRLATNLRAVVRSHVEQWTECELLDYGPATSVADHQVMWVPLADVAALQIASVSAAQADLETFDASAGVVSRLMFSVVRAATSDGTQVAFYRSLRKSEAIGRSRQIPVFRRGDVLDVVPDSTILIGRDVDAAVVDGVVFFDDRSRFQRVFRFLELLKLQAGETFDAVTADLKIKNFDALRAAATGQLQMLGKMASIARKMDQYPTYKEALTMENIVAFVQSNPHTGVVVEGEGEDAELVFNPAREHRFKILKLLDDDFLESHLTAMHYESNSKGLPL